MTRRSSALRDDDVPALPGACSSCLRWERYADGALLPLRNPRDASAQSLQEAVAAKQRWWIERLTAGTAGGVVLRLGANGVDSSEPGSRLAGYVTYVVPDRADGDALTVLGLHVEQVCRGAGLGRVLVHAVAREALRRPGVRAVEALAGCALPGGNGNGVGAEGAGMLGCLVPLEFWLACGFSVVREHPFSPRVRLDTRVLATWRTEVEGALELAWDRLRGVVRPEPAPGPALSTHPRASTPPR